MEASGKRWIIHPSRSDRFRIWNLSDLHIQSRACAEDRIVEDIQAIKDDPYSFWLGGGDYADFIGYSDKRFDPDSVAPWVSVKDLGRLGQAGMERVRDLFDPIKDKCLGLLQGNHEKRYELKTENEGLHGWLCTELGVPNLDYCALFDVVFVRKEGKDAPRLFTQLPPNVARATSFRIFAHHGAGFAQTPGGKLNKLIQFMQSFDADIYFCGHVHDQIARSEPTIGANCACNKIQQHRKVGAVSGSYLKTYAQGVCTYGEQRAYRPTTLGAAVIEICPETKEVHATV